MEHSELIEVIVACFEYGGVAAMTIGFVLALIFAGRRLFISRSGAAAFKVLREMIGASILLGLEILVAADLIRTVTSSPNMNDILILGLTVVIRTVLSMSIQIELEGTLPWKRAATLTGASAITQSVSKQLKGDDQPDTQQSEVASN